MAGTDHKYDAYRAYEHMMTEMAEEHYIASIANAFSLNVVVFNTHRADVVIPTVICPKEKTNYSLVVFKNRDRYLHSSAQDKQFVMDLVDSTR